MTDKVMHNDSVEEAEAHFRQGMVYVRSQDFTSALESFHRAIEAHPKYSLAHHNLGSTLAALGRHEEAAKAFRRALEIDPDHAQAHFNLGASLRILGESDEALTCFMRALEIDPRHDEAYYYLGLEHEAAGRLNEALACYLRASDLNPSAADIYAALAGVLVRLKLETTAVQAFQKALSLDPNDSVSRAYLLHYLARDCDWDALKAREEWIPSLGVVGGHVPPFAMLALEDHPRRHRVRSEKFAAASYSKVEPLPVPARPTARPQRVRLGYFSADFHDHATMYLAARLFELHDRDRFSIHAYSYGAEWAGPMRERAVGAFDQFRDVSGLTDQAIAEMARVDGIDIAVDLKGYTENQRLGIFARRPAPVQISYLGYPGTLGAPFIDYLIADRIVIGDGQRQAYSEQLIYLPNSYQVTDNRRTVPDPGGSRSETAGLPPEGLVFCCFNHSYKIKPVEFDIWMELLKGVEGSVLWLLATRGQMAGNLRAECARRGVDPERLIFAPRIDHEAHLARLQFADLFLDTFNYNAHTTASDALWAGVPVLTRLGHGFAARVAASLLHAVGLPELVTKTDSDYAKLALNLAQDPARLAAIRTKLAANRAAMPLFDSEMFTRHIEQAYDLAYQRHLDGLTPADIVVPA